MSTGRSEDRPNRKEQVMKIYETRIDEYVVELVDVEDAQQPNDVCLVRVLKDGAIIHELFLTLRLWNGTPRLEGIY